MKRMYYITGVSGTGKSTLAEELRKKGFYTIDQDSLCRWKNNKTMELAPLRQEKEFLEEHDWYCDVDILKRDVEKEGEKVFVVGYAANQDEYLNMFDKVFLLHCSPETLVARLETRTTNEFGKHSSQMEHILEWQKGYEKDMTDKGAIGIDAEQPLSKVLDDILSHTET